MGQGIKPFWLLFVMELVLFLARKQKFQREATETRWGECLKLKFGGETHFSGGSSFYFGGAAFQRGRYWEVFVTNVRLIEQIVLCESLDVLWFLK